jgi:ABC-2 type transport system permease protein
MAELAPQSRRPAGPWTGRQTRAQFAAIAWLRWRILVNSLRRKGRVGELIGNIVVYLVSASIVVFLVGGAGVAAYYLAGHGHLHRISWMLWGIFILCQLLNIQLAQPSTTFDPTQLIRFPLRVDTYVAIRLFFGLLTPANIVGTLMSLAVAAGIGSAAPALWTYALLTLAVFAATNVLFSRMVFAWVDRWLATRRAREIFTGLIFTFSLGIQWANFTFNPAYSNSHTHHTHGISHQHIHFIITVYRRVRPLLAALPPDLTASSLVAANQAAVASFFAYTLACALFAAAFLTVFALRMRTEFRGESLSDAATGVSRKAVRPAAAKLAHSTSTPAAVAPPTSSSSFGVPSVFVTMLGKELLYVRRHMGILYGLIMPIFLVIIFASKFAARSNSIWIFPTAVAYTLLAICPLSYNSFGFEAEGSQFYFLAPVRMRDILLAKNLFNFLLALVEIIVIFGIISYMTGMPSLQIAAAAMLWAAGTLAISSIFGNRRSISTPKKISSQRMANKQTSKLNAFISMSVLVISAGTAAGLFGICIGFHLRWALIPIFAIFAAIEIGIYIHSLGSLDQFALDHREELFTELCKQS